jgi:parallel beta-helix repeat protein
VTNNDVIGNRTAIEVFGNVTVYHNNFIDNVSAEAASEFGYVIWQDGYVGGGNYWSGWVSPDVNGDLTVDARFGRDFYPFTQPNGWLVRTGAMLEKSVHNVDRGLSYSEISPALEDAAPGDTIRLDGGGIAGRGMYYENVVLSQPQTFMSDDGAFLMGERERRDVIDIRSDGVTVRGLTITGATESTGYGLHVRYPTGSYALYDNEVHGNRTGIFVSAHESSGVIQGNTVRDNSWLGIGSNFIWPGPLLVTNNDVIGNRTAIEVFGNVTVYHNNFIDNVSAEAASEIRDLGPGLSSRW